MRPYLAVLKDSFREALASRVLWVLLIVIVALLAVVAPFGYEEVLTVDLRDRDANWVALGAALREAEQSGAQPQAHIAKMLDAQARQKLETLKRPEGRRNIADRMRYEQQVEQIRQAFNRMLRRDDFYQAGAWSGVTLPLEGRRLLRRADSLSDREKARLNRLALEAALPEVIDKSPPKSTQITYFLADVGWPLPFAHQDLEKRFQPWLVLTVDYIMGPIGLLAAILVTAPLVPQTLSPGSLNLLLSKPISRSLLFLTKFVGGCCFIILSGSLLFVGMWLILWLRLGIWNPKFLYYLPIYLLSFAIYYSVSALAGLVWRNTVISVAAAVLFWGVCFGVGQTKVLFEWLGINRTRLMRVVEAGDEVFAVDEARATYRWDDSRRQWLEAFMTDDQRVFRQQFLGLAPLPRITGPIYDPAQKRILAVQQAIPRSPTAIWSGRAEDDWRRQGGADAPERAYGLFLTPAGDVVMMGESRVHRLGADPSRNPERPKLWGFELPIGGGGAFKAVGPEESLRLDDDASAAMDPQSGAIAIYNEAELILLESSGGKLAYEVSAREKLPWDAREHAVVAFSCGRILVAGVDGRVLLINSASLAIEQTLQPKASAPPRFAAASENGRWFAVVFHDGRLWLYDAERKTGAFPGVAGQKDIMAVAFAAGDRMLAADRINRVTAYRLESLSVERRLSPPLTFTQMVYRWIVLPIYTVFPKPAELSSTSQYLVTGKRAEAIDDSDGLEAAHIQLHPWAPVWSGLGFVAVMLALSCVYMERQEF